MGKSCFFTQFAHEKTTLKTDASAEVRLYYTNTTGDGQKMQSFNCDRFSPYSPYSPYIDIARRLSYLFTSASAFRCFRLKW